MCTLTLLLQIFCIRYNACVFAYGQTGSGKTHTMMGSPTPPVCVLSRLNFMITLCLVFNAYMMFGYSCRKLKALYPEYARYVIFSKISYICHVGAVCYDPK